VVPVKNFGLMSMPTNMCAAFARGGNEQDFLGHKPFHLLIRKPRLTFQDNSRTP
jgi:hypothetical protein